jgi:ABC-type sugar transport system substrate-binding protein
VYTSGFNRNAHGGEQVTNSKHFGRGAAALGALVLVVAACSSGSASSAPASAGAASPAASGGAASPAAGGDKPTLAFIAQMQNPSQAFSWKMYQKNADKYGFNVINLDNGGDVQKQTAAINSAVAQKVQAIAINPVDEAGYVPATTAAMAGGTVVCLSMVPPADNAVDGSTCSVSVDDILGGQTAATAIQNAFPNGATGVEIGGQAGHVAANNRHTGFSDAIKGKNITVLDYKNPTAWDTAQAQAIAEDMITKYGDKIQFIFCHWDNGATGVINALKAVNQDWANKVLIIGVDGNKTGFEQVGSWPNYISIAQNAETITSKVMEESMLFIKKDPAAVKKNIIPFDIITKETIKNFTAPEW